MLGAACTSKSNEGSARKAAEPAPPAPAVATPLAGPVPALWWTDVSGELLLASGTGDRLESACGLTGTITATHVELAGVKQPWTVIQHAGRQFSMPKLDWVIEVSPTGEVTHKARGAETPLGRVTGLETDAHLRWFGAFVIGAALVQHQVGITSPDGALALELHGAADMRAWDVRRGPDRLVTKKRDDPAPVFATKPAFDPTKLTVAVAGPRAYAVTVTRDDGALRAAFPADRLVVTENDAGELAWRTADAPASKPGRPLAKLTGRTTCRPHDQAVAALVWALLGTDAGVAQLRTRK